MIGPERGRYREKVARLVADAEAAEAAGFTSIWVPAAPGRLRRAHRDRADGPGHRAAIELGTAVMPIQTRHPIAMAQQALANQAVCEGRFTLGLGPSHHWIVDGHARPAVRAARAPGAELPRGAERRVRGARAASTSRTTTFRVHNPLDVTDIAPTPILLAALAPVMLRIAGELRVGDDPLDGRRARDRRARRARASPKAAAERGPAARRGSSPASRSRCARNDEVDAARAWANRVLGHAEYSPNYQRLLEHGDATDVGDLLAGGDEAAVVERLRSFRDAGVTDLAVRVLPLGADRDARIESRPAHRGVPLVALPRALTARRFRRPGPALGPARRASACSRSDTSSPDRSAGMLLADLGADVIKIEPFEGDLSRQVGSQFVDEHNVYFASLNRNKRSVHIDLTTDDGQAQLGALGGDRARAAREPAAVDDPQARPRLRVVAPLQPEDRVRGAHRVRARRPRGRVARVRLRDPGRRRRRRDDRRARRAAHARRLLGGRQLRRGSWPRSGSSRRCSRARAARSTSRCST